jgi:hypothetical protein
VTGAVDVRVVAGVGLVLDVGDRDRDAAGPLLGSVVDRIEGAVLGLTLEGQVLRDRSGQRRLAVVDVTNRADVDVRLVALELLLRHRDVLPAPRTGAGRDPLDLRLLDELRGQVGRDLGVVTEFHG